MRIEHAALYYLIEHGSRFAATKAVEFDTVESNAGRFGNAFTITRWLSTELPTVQNLRIDLLGETSDRELTQIEVQSTNDSGIPFRMLEGRPDF